MESKIKYPCTVCGQECGDNTIECGKCEKWCHIKHYPELEGKTEHQLNKLNFYCKSCEDDKKRKGEFINQELLELDQMYQDFKSNDLTEEIHRLNEIDKKLRAREREDDLMKKELHELFKEEKEGKEGKEDKGKSKSKRKKSKSKRKKSKSKRKKSKRKSLKKRK
jgi:hypothetical protein